MGGGMTGSIKPVTYKGKQQQAWGEFMLQVNTKWADFREIVAQEVETLKTKGPDYLDTFAANTKEAASAYRLAIVPGYEEYLRELCKFEALDILQKSGVDLLAMNDAKTQAQEAKRERKKKPGKERGAGRGKGLPGVSRDVSQQENDKLNKSSWGSP